MEHPPLRNQHHNSAMKTTMPLLLLAGSLVCFVMGLTSPLLAINSRVVVGLGRFEFPAVEFAETLSIPQTVARLVRNGDFLLMVVVLCSCIVFPALKLGLLCFQAFGRGSEFWKRTIRFLERWSFLELLVLAVFLTALKTDKHLDVHSGAAVGWLIGAIILSAVAHWMMGRSVPSMRLRPVLAMLVAMGLSSCGKSPCEHYIKLDNLGGVAVGSSVMWKGAEIGKVVSIGPEDGKLKATLRLDPAFARALRVGVVAEVPGYSLPAVRGRITLVGGDISGAALLASGTELPVRAVSFVGDSVDIANEYLKAGADAIQRKIEEGTEVLKEEIPKRLDDASNAAADSLEALAKKMRR